ncbi:MAG: hypothetical protein Kow0020_10860 [Wenzhouxiangellaceae bacterium]
MNRYTLPLIAALAATVLLSPVQAAHPANEDALDLRVTLIAHHGERYVTGREYDDRRYRREHRGHRDSHEHYRSDDYDGWRDAPHHRHRDHYTDKAYVRARRYAQRAVEQARAARRLGVHPDHPRWSLNYHRHLRWALHQPRRVLKRELRIRDAQLEQWRRDLWYHGHHHHDGRHLPSCY